MSNRETLDYDPVDALIEQGRRELAEGRVEKASWCFQEVLRRRPDEPRALLGLKYAERKSEAPPSDAGSTDTKADTTAELDGAAAVLTADVEVVVLVREKRYGEALVRLRAELAKRPDDAALKRSIAHLEKHIGRPSARPPARSPAASPAAPDELAPKTRTTKSEPPAATPARETERGSSLPPSPLSTRPTPAVEVDLSVTQPFELMRVADTRRASLEAAKAAVAEVDDAREEQAEREVEPQEPTSDAGVPAPKELTDSGEVRLDLTSSSGGFQVADDDPSGPALGSLPPAPAPTSDGEGGNTKIVWAFAFIALVVAVLAWALR